MNGGEDNTPEFQEATQATEAEWLAFRRHHSIALTNAGAVGRCGQLMNICAILIIEVEI